MTTYHSPPTTHHLPPTTHLGHRGRPENQSGHFGPAVVAHGVLAGQTAADVQDRRWFMEGPAIIAPAIRAWHQYRANQRKADLAAVIVAGQHQIDLLLPGPGDVIGGVAQT